MLCKILKIQNIITLSVMVRGIHSKYSVVRVKENTDCWNLLLYNETRVCRIMVSFQEI
jgi:hypothetical protein